MATSPPRITLKELALRLGLTPRAVSQALRQDGGGTTRVAAKTIARVRALADQGGYRINTSARALRTSRFRQVGILAQYDFENRLPPMVETPAVFGLGDYLNTQGWHLVILQDNQERSEGDSPAFVREHSLDGLVLTSQGTKKDEKRTEELVHAGVPSVWFNSNAPTNAVGIRDVIGAEMATQHLIEHGHQRIVFVAGGSKDHGSRVEREAGYRNVMKTYGFEPVIWDSVLDRTQNRDINRAAWCRRIVDDLMPNYRPTGLVCYSDIEAINVSRTLHSIGVAIPAQLSIVGYNDLPFVDIAYPPLTTVRADFYLLGRMAGEMLLELLRNPEGGPTLESRFISPEMIIRGSTGPAPRGAGI